MKPRALEFVGEVFLPSLRKVRIAAQPMKKINLRDGNQLCRCRGDRVAMVPVSITGCLGHNAPGSAFLEDQYCPVWLVPDEVHKASRDDVNSTDVIAETEQMLPGRQGKRPGPCITPSVSQKQHDYYHVLARGVVAREACSKEAKMRRAILLSMLLFPAIAVAQTMPGHHPGMMAPQAGKLATPTQPGQGAFAAIQEIVEILESDPATDWGKVNIAALRQHLIDMDNVTLHADVTAEPVEGGMRFIVSGAGAIRDSIRRMVPAQAAMMDGAGGWQLAAATRDDGATLLVKAPAQDIAKVHALGFIGILTRGTHHQMHHLMIARGDDPHQH